MVTTKQSGRRRRKKGSKPVEGTTPMTSPVRKQPANGTGYGGGPDDRTYFKVFAAFKCSSDACKRSWMSAHAWEREDDEGGINCEVCQTPAELMNAVDETLKLDTYICGCENIWQSIHVEMNLTVPQECDICRVMVFPDGPPQERFGRHYWLRCMNKTCPEKEAIEWEDFSLNKQKTQRCTKCGNRGDIVSIKKLRQLPVWLWRKRREERLKKGRGEQPDMEEKPSNHVYEFCEMCQDIRRQGKGRNCRAWRLIKTQLMPDPETGELIEKIVDMAQASENPFHFESQADDGGPARIK